MLDKQGLAQEVVVGVTYSSLMSAVSLFFTGVLISNYDKLDRSIKVPLIFLIISTFSFIFSATIYNNAGTEITLGKMRVVEKYMIYGKNIMELLGLYPFILATPLVIGAVTHDGFLRTTTILVAITGFGLYSQSKFSILEKELVNSTKKLLTGLIVVLSLSLYYFQSIHPEALFTYSSLAVALLAVILMMTYHFSLHSKQYKPTYFRTFQSGDAEKLSTIIMSNLHGVKTKQLSADEVDEVHKNYSADALGDLANKKQVFVAEFNDQVVGLAALSSNTISDVFTDRNLHRKGIGRRLVEYVEEEARRQGAGQVKALASAFNYDFYKRLGYREVSNKDGRVTMSKVLRAE